ncbi:hypothetical protein WG66_001724 [Moniliophthora roreri]|nr:hypothetical protein WG66_001724 [Moniliophthora roreri]
MKRTYCAPFLPPDLPLLRARLTWILSRLRRLRRYVVMYGASYKLVG